MATTERKITNSTSAGPYSFTFPYMKDTDVKVSKNGVLLTKGSGATEYTQATTSITLNTALINSDNLRIYRETDDSGLTSTFYPGSAIRSNDLNDNFTQNLYSTQENTNDASTALDNSRVLESGAYVSAITKAAAAVTTANTASTNASSAVTTANTANTTAGNAVTSAATANTTAGNAVTTANAADTKADTAITTANTASTNASAAVTTANTASTNASAAVTTANTASTNASSAVTTANTASTNASAAVTTANQAAADVAAAVLFTTVANKAALEALTPTEDAYYQTTDSTGLANGTFTNGGVTYTVSGIPGTYPNTQLSGITTKFSYTHSSKTYAYTSYFANDSDDRYMVGPASDGNANEVLTTNGSGVLTWEVGGNVTIDAGNFDTGASLVSTTVTYDGGEFT